MDSSQHTHDVCSPMYKTACLGPHSRRCNRASETKSDIVAAMSEQYYKIAEGNGGIFTLPISANTTDSVFAIGTMGCQNCVGVYIPLSDDKCFAAHIYACREESDSEGELQNFGEWIPEGKQGEWLTEKIGNLLEAEVGEHLPSQEKLNRWAGNAIVVCPRLREEDQDAVGTYILRGLQDFFKIPLTAKAAHGFGVNHSTGDVRLFKFHFKGRGMHDSFDFDAENSDDLKEISDQDCGWKSCNGRNDERNKQNNWRITTVHGEWHEEG